MRIMHQAIALSINCWIWHLPEFDLFAYWYEQGLKNSVVPYTPGW